MPQIDIICLMCACPKLQVSKSHTKRILACSPSLCLYSDHELVMYKHNENCLLWTLPMNLSFELRLFFFFFLNVSLKSTKELYLFLISITRCITNKNNNEILKYETSLKIHVIDLLEL